MQHRNRATAHMTLVAGALAAGLLVMVLGLAGCSGGGGKGTTTSKGSTAGTGSGTATLGGAGRKAAGRGCRQDDSDGPLGCGEAAAAVAGGGFGRHTGVAGQRRRLLSGVGQGPERRQVRGSMWIRAISRSRPGARPILPTWRAPVPPAASLIPTSSLELILTFQVPAGVKPDLLYRPPWYGGRIVVKGQRKPIGVVSAAVPGGRCSAPYAFPAGSDGGGEEHGGAHPVVGQLLGGETPAQLAGHGSTDVGASAGLGLPTSAVVSDGDDHRSGPAAAVASSSVSPERRRRLQVRC